MSGDLLYKEEFDCMQRNVNPDQLRIDYAISRGITNPVDDGKIAQHGRELFDQLDAGAHVYFCGLKGMMPTVLDALEAGAEDRGVVWSKKLKALKEKGQWYVEVY